MQYLLLTATLCRRPVAPYRVVCYGTWPPSSKNRYAYPCNLFRPSLGTHTCDRRSLAPCLQQTPRVRISATAYGAAFAGTVLHAQGANFSLRATAFYRADAFAHNSVAIKCSGIRGLVLHCVSCVRIARYITAPANVSHHSVWPSLAVWSNPKDFVAHSGPQAILS